MTIRVKNHLVTKFGYFSNILRTRRDLEVCFGGEE